MRIKQFTDTDVCHTVRERRYRVPWPNSYIRYPGHVFVTDLSVVDVS